MLTLQVRGATRQFGDHRVFSGVELDVEPGERVFLAGPNGSGKTTLLRCIAGTLALSAGSVLVEGRPAGVRAARSRVGLSLNPEQAFNLRLTGHDNLVFAARLRLAPRFVGAAVTAVEEELAITGFAGERVAQYSSGMRARVAMARALLGAPSLLLLDEPTRSLDAEGRARLWAALERRSVACVIASHRGSDQARCDRELRLPIGADVGAHA